MVSTDEEWPAQQVQSEVLEKEYYSEEFSPSYTVTALLLGRHTAAISNHLLTAIPQYLSQDSTYSCVAGISIQNKLACVIGECWTGAVVGL